MLNGVGMQRFLELKMFWVYSLEQSHKGTENLWQFLQNDLLKVFHLKKKKKNKTKYIHNYRIPFCYALRKKSREFKDNYPIRAMLKLPCHIPIFFIIALTVFMRIFKESALKTQLSIERSFQKRHSEVLLVNNV